MKLTINISPRNIVNYLTIGVTVLALLSFGVQIIKYVFNYREGWLNTFNLDAELNIPTWYSFFLLVSCAALLGIIAHQKKLEKDRFAGQWKTLAWIFFVFAWDETLSIHEILIIPDVAKALHLAGFFRPIWVIPGAILVYWFIRKYLKFRSHLPRTTRRYFTWAAVLYVGGALGMEMLGGQYVSMFGQRNLGYAMMANIEEILEMMGTITFIYGLLDYLRQIAPQFQVQFNFRENSIQNPISQECEPFSPPISGRSPD